MQSDYKITLSNIYLPVPKTKLVADMNDVLLKHYFRVIRDIFPQSLGHSFEVNNPSQTILHVG